jgi:hypothetical protein
MNKSPKLLAEIKGKDGFSIGLFETDYHHELMIAVIDADDEATPMVLPIGMVNALAHKLMSWVSEAVGKSGTTETPGGVD